MIEKAEALRYLQESRDGLVDLVDGLSESQWTFKPAPDRWSAAEIVEHLAIVEDIVSKRVQVDLRNAPPAPADRDPEQVDTTILKLLADRTVKYPAPPAGMPTGRWTPAGGLAHFLESRKQTAAAFEAGVDLREHAVDHPVFGPLDGYQWVLAVASHSARHTKQILEVMADPNYPANREEGETVHAISAAHI